MLVCGTAGKISLSLGAQGRPHHGAGELSFSYAAGGAGSTGVGGGAGNGFPEMSCRNCHDKPACLEVRADFEKQYYKRQVEARF